MGIGISRRDPDRGDPHAMLHLLRRSGDSPSGWSSDPAVATTCMSAYYISELESLLRRTKKYLNSHGEPIAYGWNLRPEEESSST